MYAGFAWSKNLSILEHPVNPVIYMDVVYAGFAWSKNLSILKHPVHPVCFLVSRGLAGRTRLSVVLL